MCPRDAAHSRLRAAAHRWAGDDVCEIPSERPTFLWLYGSTMIEARAERDGSIELRAFLVLGPETTGSLEEQLRLFSAPVGRLEVDEDGDLALVHRVPPRAAEDRVLAAIREVSCFADQFDEELCQRFGGIRSVDRFQHDVLAALGGQN